jgi:hypothetical protein
MKNNISYSRYLSSDDFSKRGIPDRKRMISVVNIGDKMANHSSPSRTFSEIMKIPHHSTISPK